jgi:hypothetical protein
MTVLEYRSTSPSEGELARPQGHWLLWAIYLAMSWTWCIGMFLPVLLVRDFGIWGWIVFAVPNVIGAAAMGWVLRKQKSSADLVQAHWLATSCFSAVTVSFQFFFAFWMFERAYWLVLCTIVLAATLLPFGSRLGARGFELFIASGVLVVSVVCGLVTWKGIGTVPAAPVDPPLGAIELFSLAPVIVFGFLLCPYLDLTLNHARRQTSDHAARFAFGFGFGLLFLAMIAFTLVYRQHVPLGFLNVGVNDAARWGLAMYFVVQLAFTSGVHLRETASRSSLWHASGLLVFGAVVGTLSYWAADQGEYLAPTARAEVVYRLYMGFYGLVFPAYVWLCMIPSPWRSPSRRAVLAFAVAVLIAAPFFWLGFIEGRMVWLLPGLAIVLAARVLLPRRETLAKI